LHKIIILKFISFLIFYLFIVLHLFAQNTNKLLRSGNSSFEKNKFAEAETYYEKALLKIPKSLIAHYNKGNAQYRQNANVKAAESYENAAKNTSNLIEKSNAYYNKGNAYSNDKKWENAIEAYKNSLRNNPNDVQTKYNLSYAMKMLKKEKENKENKKNEKNQDKKEQKDKEDNKNQDNKNEDKKEQKGKEDNNKNEEKGKSENEKNEEKSKPKPQISKEEAERILQALQAEDQKTQDKVNGKLIKGGKVKNEQNW
jgi:Ca-activated chloride channel family protein